MTKPTSPDKWMLVAMPVVQLRTPVEGAIIHSCENCHERVWIAPSTQRLLAQVMVLCIACATAAVGQAQRAGEPVEFGGFLDGQRDEIERAEK